MSTVSKRKQIEALIIVKFWYQNETYVCINQWLIIKAKQTEVALNCTKTQQSKEIYSRFFGAKQNDGSYAKASKSWSKTNGVSLERWNIEAKQIKSIS